MRFLTSLSSIIMAATGAFCFAYSGNGYDGVAFALSIAMLLCGLFITISYCIGFRKSLLPETVLAEGLYSFAFGLLIVANLIPAQHIDVYFGAWTLIAGLSRISQSLAVSKINPRNWFSVMPLGLVLAMAGFIMLVPNFLADYDILYVIAVIYIINAFSLAIYSVNMVKRHQSQKAKEARERAEAKKKLAEEKRKERDRQRSLSEAERSKERSKVHEEKLRQEEEKRAAKEARKEARRPASERTVEFSQEETEEIIKLADESAKNQFDIEMGEADSLSLDDDRPIEASDLWGNDNKANKIEDIEAAARPVFNRPTNIPIIEKQTVVQEKTDDVDVEAKRSIVNLEEMENKVPDLGLPEIELPEFKLQAEGGEAEKRHEYLLELEEEKPKVEEVDDLASFTPLTLEELFADERFNIKPLSDQRATETDLKLTQTFTFDWLDMKR